METCSAITLLSVFIFGAAVGALLVAIHRQCAMERLKRDFEAQLFASIDKTFQNSPDDVKVPGRFAPPSAVECDSEYMDDENTDAWQKATDHLPGPGGPSIPTVRL